MNKLRACASASGEGMCCPMKSLNTCAGEIPVSVIHTMTEVAYEYDAINLSQGFPSFTPPKALTDRLSEVTHGGPNQYAISYGAANFREALTQKVNRFTKMDFDPDENVVVCNGCTEALLVALFTVVAPGDKVVVFDPCYENYVPDIRMAGAEPIFVQLTPPSFSFSEEELDRACSDPAVKALILNNPHNPSGKVFDRDELTAIAHIAEAHDLYVITDEVYEHIVYEPMEHIYFCTLPGMDRRTIMCSSLSETFSITGWRLGYLYGPKEIVDTAKRVHERFSNSSSAPLMEAAVAGLMFPDAYYEALKATYTAKRRLFCSGLDALGIPYIQPQGTFYVLCDISGFSMGSDTRFALEFARRVGVAGVPASYFFQHPERRYIRFHFAREDRILNDALERMVPAKRLLD